jgi:hypothetical protein
VIEPILYCGIVPYDSLRQRPQWLADGLSERTPVLYVNPRRSLLRGARSQEGHRHISAQLFVLEPPAALPFSGYWRPLNRVNSTRTARAVRQVFTELGWQRPRWMWAAFPKDLDLATALRPERLCYDVMDDYPLFFDRWQGMSTLTGIRRNMNRSPS